MPFINLIKQILWVCVCVLQLQSVNFFGDYDLHLIYVFLGKTDNLSKNNVIQIPQKIGIYIMVISPITKLIPPLGFATLHFKYAIHRLNSKEPKQSLYSPCGLFKAP